MTAKPSRGHQPRWFASIELSYYCRRCMGTGVIPVRIKEYEECPECDGQAEYLTPDGKELLEFVRHWLRKEQ